MDIASHFQNNQEVAIKKNFRTMNENKVTNKIYFKNNKKFNEKGCYVRENEPYKIEHCRS